jgi:hypothetical protein
VIVRFRGTKYRRTKISIIADFGTDRHRVFRGIAARVDASAQGMQPNTARQRAGKSPHQLHQPKRPSGSGSARIQQVSFDPISQPRGRCHRSAREIPVLAATNIGVRFSDRRHDSAVESDGPGTGTSEPPIVGEIHQNIRGLTRGSQPLDVILHRMRDHIFETNTR